MARQRRYTDGRTEPNMRDELNYTFDGIFPEISKKQPAVLRKMRRDSDGDLIECACVDILTHEPDRDHFCPYCHGDGYYWDEMFFDVYKVEISSDVGKAHKEKLISPGLINIPTVIFYARSSVDITKEDSIVEIYLDNEGNILRPYKRKALYKIGTLLDMRSDHGKLEYWKIDTHKEQRKFLNGII